MFSTPLGAARLKQAHDPERVLQILRRAADDNSLSLDGIELNTYKTPSALGDHYHVRCSTCDQSESRAVRDGSPDFSLDRLLSRVVQFVKNHQHGPQPVLDIAGSFPPALTEYPKGYRKFREV